MIRFAAKPDTVFSGLLNGAIEKTVESYLNFDDPRDQEDWLCACMPRSARFFTATEAKQQLLALQRAHNDSRLHQLTKYHWLLLYECLESFSDEFNEQPVGPLVHTYGIRRIHFGRLVDLFFWDTDFLEHNSGKMTRHQREIIVIIPETLGLSAGFKHHPDELAINLCEETAEREFENNEVIAFASGTQEYPVLSYSS